MTIETKCQCGSREYELVDSSLGKVRCVYCQALRVEPSLVKKTETEKFLELQKQRPKVVISETALQRDEEILRNFLSFFAFGGLKRKIKRGLRNIAILLFLIVLIIILYKVGAFAWIKFW